MQKKNALQRCGAFLFHYHIEGDQASCPVHYSSLSSEACSAMSACWISFGTSS